MGLKQAEKGGAVQTQPCPQGRSGEGSEVHLVQILPVF